MNRYGSYPAGGPLYLGPEQRPLLLVAGEGRIEASPDAVEASLGFTTRAEQASAAFQQTAAAMNQVVQALLAIGISREQMQTGQVSLLPVYEKERQVGYEGSSTLRVTVRDVSSAGAVIDRAVTAGATIVHGVRFEVRDPSPYEANALALAVRDARRQAEVLAPSLGVQLGPVWRAEAEASGPGPIVPLLARQAFAEGIPILPGTLSITRRVRVEYMIHPR